ncbi:SgcJ/EcaC family oxidoreductase [Ensifer sp. MPMI2T]|nr:SgcJ/EcaC family oxidoreductase [Ensifer sp. MPMI2T]
MSDMDIRVIVSQANDRWNAAFNRGDAAAVAALYTPDATVLPHTHAVVKGQAAIADFWAGLISAGVKGHGIELLDAQAAGDVAYSSGKWWATGSGEDGRPAQFEGTIVTIWRKQNDGSWKLCLHTWN